VITELNHSYQLWTGTGGKSQFGQVRGQGDDALGGLVGGDWSCCLLTASGQKECGDQKGRA
jgi:hypothetical protein